MNQFNDLSIFDNIKEYCEAYRIPLEHFMDILEDQKVLPMIRGKANEYIAKIVLERNLSRSWRVQKLNLNAQPGRVDEDIAITHARTGRRLKVEAKSAVRGSFRLGTPRTKINAPHFKVKCHRSRSNIKKSKTTNDRYLVNDFDLIICNVSNALFAGKTIGDNLELINNEDAIKHLKLFYNTQIDGDLIDATYRDWLCCFPRTIAETDGSLPRTPPVKLTNDENWFRISHLEKYLNIEIQKRT